MKQLSLTAEKRESGKKNASYKARQTNRIAAVLYGQHKDNVLLTVPQKEILKIINDDKNKNAIINLSISGENEPRKVLIKDIQTDVVKNKLIHIDFYEISLTHMINVTVPVHLTGRAKGTAEGGILEHKLRELDIKCLATDIPEFIEVDITNLNIGDSIHVSDLKLGDKIKIITDAKRVVAVVTAIKEETEAAAAGETAAEGEAAATADASASAEKTTEDKAADKAKTEKK